MIRFVPILRLLLIWLVFFGMVFPAGAAQVSPEKKDSALPGTYQNPAKPQKTDKIPPAPATSAVKPAAPVKEMQAFAITRIYAEGDHLRVVLQGPAVPPGRQPNRYESMQLRLTSPPNRINAELALVDLLKNKKTRRHGTSMDLYTGILLNHTGMVSAVLTAGQWKTAKSALISVAAPATKTVGGVRPEPLPKPRRVSPLAAESGPDAPVMASSAVNQKNLPAALSPAGTNRIAAAARAERRAGSAPEPQTRLLDNGIRISLPTESTHPMPGDACRVQYRFTRPAPAGDIVFELVNGANIVLRTTRPYTPPVSGDLDDTTETFFWLFPDDLEPGQNYFILATHDVAFGLSSSFGVGENGGKRVRPVPGETDPIRVTWPRRGDLVVQDVEMDIAWTMPGEMSIFTCSNRVDISAVSQADGRIVSIRNGIDCHEDENRFSWNPRAILSRGEWAIRVAAADGCQGESGVFRVDACDYAIESVAIHGAGSLAAGLDVRGDATISGDFDVRIRWNGITVPSNLPPGTFWDNRLTVTAALTGANLTLPEEGASFTYRALRANAPGTFSVLVPFRFERDDIPAMRNGRHIPLVFSFQSLGASIDSDASNNTFSGDMRILGATDNDLRIAIYARDFDLYRRSRFPGTAPVWRCRFEQEVTITNLSVTDAGGPASPIGSVPCRWEMQYRNDGDSEFRTFESGAFTMENVRGGAWVSRGIEGHFRVNYEITDRTYRLMVIADPDSTLLDPNRSNNRATLPFRLPD